MLTLYFLFPRRRGSEILLTPLPGICQASADSRHVFLWVQKLKNYWQISFLLTSVTWTENLILCYVEFKKKIHFSRFPFSIQLTKALMSENTGIFWWTNFIFS